MEIPIYRARRLADIDYLEGNLCKSDIGKLYLSNSQWKTHWQEIDPTTLAIKMPERDFFMSLDIENGIGGDLLPDNEVLAWNGSMMACCVIQFSEDGEREDYVIDLDNSDYDRMETVGIKEK